MYRNTLVSNGDADKRESSSANCSLRTSDDRQNAGEEVEYSRRSPVTDDGDDVGEQKQEETAERKQRDPAHRYCNTHDTAQ